MSMEEKTLGVSDCFGHESENNCKPVAALFCVAMQAAPALCASLPPHASISQIAK